jgi:uncharacterized pyridoxamine 5'-phosphate oxidase family protein
MGYYLNMVGNEMFMDTSQLRSSILSHAKNINYTPTSRKAAKALVDIQIKPSNTEDNTKSSLTLTKYTKFLGQAIDGINYNFVAVNSNTVVKVGDTFNFSNVQIKQGDVISLQYLMDPTNRKRKFIIPSANVDTDTLEVRVQESTSNTDLTIYNKSESIVDLNANSTVYFIEENDALTYNIYFGDNVIGKTPKVGNVINITYLDTVGTSANSIAKFTAKDKIGNLYRDNVVVTSVTTSYGGTDKESIEQIRFRAPYAYTTQNRGVTTGDYETILLKEYPDIQAVSVWGGEDNDPVVYGKVFFSIKTRQNYALTNNEKEYIKKFLIKEKNVVTVTPEIVDPDYVYIRVVSKITYNPNLTTRSEKDIAQLVRAAILDYNQYELNDFTSVFRKSKIQNYIEAADKSITGIEVVIYVQKRVILDTISSKKYDINFNMPIEKGNYRNRLYSFPEIQVADINGITRNVLFEELFDSLTGINSINIVSSGSKYTYAPTVVISGDGVGASAIATISNGRVTKIQLTNKGSGYTRATIALSGGGGSGAVVQPLLEVDYSTLRSFYYKDTGEKVSVNTSAGSINYNTGAIALNAFRTTGPIENNFYQPDEFTFFAPAGVEIINPIRNRILNIDDADSKSIQIEMVAEK